MHYRWMLSVKCYQMVISYFKLVQVGGALPVLVISDARHAGEADGDAVGCVHLWFGKLCACDLPDRSFLQQTKQRQQQWSIYDKANIWLRLHKMRKSNSNFCANGRKGHQYYCVRRVCEFHYWLLFSDLKARDGHLNQMFSISEGSIFM